LWSSIRAFSYPIASTSEEVEISILVDKNIWRVKELANKFDIKNVSDDYRQVIGKVDAAILAVPYHLHAPIAIDLLNNGIHVLVEKPMALSLAECNSMISVAEQSGAILTVGLIRRFLHLTQFAKQIIENNILGNIKTFDFQEGGIYNWPAESDFFFHKETDGGGVLIDTGHIGWICCYGYWETLIHLNISVIIMAAWRRIVSFM